MSNVRYDIAITSTNKVSCEVKVEVDSDNMTGIDKLRELAREQAEKAIEEALDIKGKIQRRL